MNNKHSSHTSDEQERGTAYLIHPDISKNINRHDLPSIIEELEGLARAINLDIAATKILNVGRIQAGAFLGKGQRADIGKEIEALEPELVIFNDTLSPVQQRNLEKEWNAKVIDRTGLILEIFGARADTKEGRLQVDLAALEYQRSRLVRSWTHLERQRGGAGFMGGPGERQIELDRRMIGERITRLKKELEDVRRTRDLGRKSRERVPFPVIALVGYTNAGKSTLFNALTKANVFAEDLPFATLDPKLRRLDLPGGQKAILSDTVGFISALPTHLVAAFRATLEQTSYAEVIAHVIDVSKPDYVAQRQDVIDILEDLGINYEKDERIIEVYNKIDVLGDDDLAEFERKAKFNPQIVLVSALKGNGLEDVLSAAEDIITRHRQDVIFDLGITDGKALSWLYEQAEVLEREDFEDHIRVHVMIEPADLAKFTNRHGYKPIQGKKKSDKKRYGGH